MTYEEQRKIALKHIDKAINRIITACEIFYSDSFNAYLLSQYRLEAIRIVNFARDLELITLDECKKYDELIDNCRCDVQ